MRNNPHTLLQGLTLSFLSATAGIAIDRNQAGLACIGAIFTLFNLLRDAQGNNGERNTRAIAEGLESLRGKI